MMADSFGQVKASLWSSVVLDGCWVPLGTGVLAVVPSRALLGFVLAKSKK